MITGDFDFYNSNVKNVERVLEKNYLCGLIPFLRIYCLSL